MRTDTIAVSYSLLDEQEVSKYVYSSLGNMVNIGGFGRYIHRFNWTISLYLEILSDITRIIRE
jgi:hypothetical protein